VGSSLYRLDLLFARLEAEDAAEVLGVLAGAVVDRGLARTSLARAVLEREARSPTGLPLAGRKVAIPHADPEHVIAPAIALCTLARPVLFGEMGNPGSRLPVEAVALLALPDHESAQHELVELVDKLQAPAFVDALVAAPDAASLLALLEGGAP
jgi:galactitol PTS system EIIA component